MGDIEEDCKLLNCNCNTRSKMNWSVAAMHFHYALIIVKKIRPHLFKGKGINDFKFQGLVKCWSGKFVAKNVAVAIRQ